MRLKKRTTVIKAIFAPVPVSISGGKKRNTVGKSVMAWEKALSG